MTHRPINSFKAYDVRGKLGPDINEDVAYRIGRGMVEFLSAKTIAVGGDVRLSTPELKTALMRGICDAGADAYDIGLAGTEQVYFAVNHLNCDGGVEVTASHNPIDYNGFKLVKHHARPISSDTGLFDIKAIAEAGTFKDSANKGAVHSIDIFDAYIDKLMSFVGAFSGTKPLKLVINSGNGAAGPVVNALEDRLIQANSPLQLIKLYNDPDGAFPNGVPNPMLEENREDSSEAILKHKADMGIAFDGDFDRCFFFDEKGRYVDGCYVVSLLARHFLEQQPDSHIVYDPRVIWNTLYEIDRLGGQAVISKSGHSFMKDVMREVDAIYGGELSAHHYFRDFYYCDSGMIPWLIVCQILMTSDKKMSEVADSYYEAFPCSGEINLTVDDSSTVLKQLEKHYARDAVTVDHTDGLSMSFQQWRFNIRQSNTEPLIRLNIESKGDKKLLQIKINELQTLILNDI